MSLKAHRQSIENGFTLVELLVTLAVVAILLGIAVPNFSNLVKSNAIASQTNHFTTAINLARSEAIKRNARVIICKRTGTTCSSSAQWEDGWVVFADTNSNNQVDTGEEIRILDPLNNNYTLRASSSTLNWIAFRADGKALRNGATFTGATFSLCGPNSDTTSSRSITMNTVGRARLSKGTSSCP